MEYASDAYKTAMSENVRGKSYVWVSLDLVNTYAQESAYVSSSFTGSEDNLYNEAEADAGVTSTESDGSITFAFGEYTTLLLSGVRFTLGTPLPATVTITNGSVSKVASVTSATMVIDKAFENCSYLKITPISGNLNIKKISFGTVLEFDNHAIMNTSRDNTVRHLNDELPMKEFSFTAHNYDRLWNSDNPGGYARFLAEKQKVVYKYGRELGVNNIYEIQGGVVYLRTWSSDDYKANFACVGLLDYCESEYTKGRFYPEGITLYQLAELVLQDAGIVLYELDAVLRTFTIYNPLPRDTHKACLQMIAHAGRCVLYEDRNGAVCLKSIDRPEILKTATVTDATDFSSGNDVITTTTVANYGSTEPEYTKADGLHYFYPEVTTQEVVDKSVNYIPFPFEDTSQTLYGLTVTVNNNKSVTMRGDYEGDPNFLRFTLATNLTLPRGKYVFCGASDPQVAVTFTGGNLHMRGSTWVYAYASYENRVFELSADTTITAIEIYANPNNSYDITLYPAIYKIIETATEEIETLPVGFVSQEYANSSGTFTSDPKIDIKFESPCILSEVVMNCPVAPKDFTIKAFLNNVQQGIITVTSNTNPQITEEFNSVKCDRVEIAFTKTTAYQRIHVNNIELAADVDYEITYHDMTSTPVATALEKLSTMTFELTSYTLLNDAGKNAALGNPTIEYTEIEGGGLLADISLGVNALASMDVVEGVNVLEVNSPSIITSVVYTDEGAGTCSIIESGAYYVKVDCSRAGTVAIKGNEYMENVTYYDIPVNEIGNPVTVKNPLISTKAHADRLKDWFLDYYTNDIEYVITYRGDPILDADDTIFIENQFVDNNLVRIESESLSTSGGMDTTNQIVARRISYKERT